MNTTYCIEDKKVIIVFNQGEHYEERSKLCECENPTLALDLWKKARFLNDEKRQYTASAKLIFKMENIKGFNWLS